jgi:hypothetical protein
MKYSAVEGAEFQVSNNRAVLSLPVMGIGWILTNTNYRQHGPQEND